jgi:hypothetical protein|tara:strand:+ start:453 stop:662 length:210 start_codon:yes stop_codon:yes gene_type:complete
MDDLEKDFKNEDIPEKGRKGENNVWREVAEKFPQGKEVLLYLAKNYGGERIYVQHYDTVMRPVRYRHYS